MKCIAENWYYFDRSNRYLRSWMKTTNPLNNLDKFMEFLSERQRHQLQLFLGWWNGFLRFDPPIRASFVRFLQTRPSKPSPELRLGIQSCWVWELNLERGNHAPNFRDNGIFPLLEVDDMIMMGDKPDWKCVFTYVQSFYKQFRDRP